MQVMLACQFQLPHGSLIVVLLSTSLPTKGVRQVAVTSVVGIVVTLENVLYVPGIRKNLISISAFATCGHEIVFDGHRCAVYDLSHVDAIVLIGTL